MKDRIAKSLIEEAEARGIFFTQDTGRAYTAEVDEEVKKELVRRVIAPMFPDVTQREFFLTCLSIFACHRGGHGFV